MQTGVVLWKEEKFARFGSALLLSFSPYDMEHLDHRGKAPQRSIDRPQT
jgi:hypothetical protein